MVDFEIRFGGEIRVELHVLGTLIDPQGNALINCDLKLFEGESETTDDLDGEKQFGIYVPVGQTATHFVRVDNPEIDAGDYVTVSMAVSNVAA